MTLRNLKPNKITLRYLGLTSLGLLLAELLFGIIQVRWQYNQRVENLNTRINDLGKEIIIISQDSQLKLDDSTLERLMRQSNVGRHLVYGMIVDAQGKPLSSLF